MWIFILATYVLYLTCRKTLLGSLKDFFNKLQILGGITDGLIPLDQESSAGVLKDTLVILSSKVFSDGDKSDTNWLVGVFWVFDQFLSSI